MEQDFTVLTFHQAVGLGCPRTGEVVLDAEDARERSEHLVVEVRPAVADEVGADAEGGCRSQPPWRPLMARRAA